jgi:hypothetical protein
MWNSRMGYPLECPRFVLATILGRCEGGDL